MAEQSIIVGTIDGIVRRDYEKLKKDLTAYFEKASWKDDTLYISSAKKHESVKEIATKIANCIAEGRYGSLLFIGNNRVVCIYFGHQRFVAKHYIEPEPPEWWGEENEAPAQKDPSGKKFFDTFKKMAF